MRRISKQKLNIHEIKSFRYTAVKQFMSDFGLLKRTRDHRRYYHPQSNTRRECTNSRRQPSLNRQHPLQEQGRLRAGYETRTESYEILLYYLQQYKGYTINSAYHNVVVEKGWAGLEDVSRKRESSALSSLPSCCSLHDASRQPIAPDLQ